LGLVFKTTGPDP